MKRSWRICLLGLLLAAGSLAGAGRAGAPTSAPGSDGESARLDELNARFLLDALRVRVALRQQGVAEREFAASFWTLAREFADIASRADGEERSLFIPLLEALQGTLDQPSVTDGTLDVATLGAVRASLQEQVEAHRAYGSAPGARHGTDFEVRAFRAPDQPALGLGVWVDLACCVAPGRSAQPLQQLTNSARGRGRIGTYMIRLRDGNRTIACRRALIRRLDGKAQPVELTINDHDC